MLFPRSIVIPALLALVAMALIGGFLVWQLDRARLFLQKTPQTQTSSGATIRTISPLPPVINHDNSALSALRSGDLFALRGEWTAAEKDYARAVDAGGGITALRKLAQAQLQRRNIDAARETLRTLRSAGARDEDLVLLESIIQLRSGNNADALRILTEASESPQKHYGLALLAIINQRHDDARQSLATVIAGWEPTLRSYAKTLLAAYDEYSLFADSPESHRQTLLARALADIGECELALPILATVLTTSDDYRDAWIVQGYCQLTTERPDAAKLSLERAYAIDPQKPEIQYFLARTFSILGDHQAAVTYLTYALENGFTPVTEAKRLLAAEAFAIGNSTLALQQLDDLTRMDTATVDAFSEFVTASLSIGHTEEAYARAQAAVQLHQDSAIAHELLGWAAMETQRLDEARAELTTALTLDPSLQSARERLDSL